MNLAARLTVAMIALVLVTAVALGLLTYRNVAAFDFVFAELRQSERAHGAANAKMERSVMVERAVSLRLPRLDVEAAITIMIMNEILIEKNGVLGFASGKSKGIFVSR